MKNRLKRPLKNRLKNQRVVEAARNHAVCMIFLLFQAGWGYPGSYYLHGMIHPALK
jgi:hypothetical protein